MHDIIEQNIGNTDLLRCMVECRLSLTAMDRILKILRSYTNPNEIRALPATFRTAVGPYPKFRVKRIDNDDIEHEEEDEEDIENDFSLNETQENTSVDAKQFIYLFWNS